MMKPSRVPLWARLSLVGVAALGAWVGYHAWSEARRRPAASAPRVELEVDGLDCPVWCAVRLTERIDALDGAVVETLDQQSGRVVVRHDPARISLEALRAQFEAAGFPVESVRARGDGR